MSIKKDKLEREVFREFVTLAGLPVLLDSIMSRRPPEPDILCTLTGGEIVAFELVEIVDQDLAKIRGDMGREKTGGVGFAWPGDPTLDRIAEKLTVKTYVTPHPIELLAWCNTLLLPPSSWFPTYEEPLCQLMEANRHVRRLWIVNFERRESSVLFSYPVM